MPSPNPLRAWRASRTQPEAAALLGVPLQTYRNWEQGRRRVPSLVWRVIELLPHAPQHKDQST